MGLAHVCPYLAAQAVAEALGLSPYAREADILDPLHRPRGRRGGAMALCLSDQASFDLFIERSVPRFAHLLKPATTSVALPRFGRNPGPAISSAEAIAICKRLGLKPGSLLD